MHSYDLKIGAEVRCRDGGCGRLHKVVLDPHTQRVTDLIVERGFLLTTDRVLPVDLVERAAGEEIYLGLASDELSGYPEYREFEFEEPAPEAGSGRYEWRDVRCWARGYRMACREPVVPTIRRPIHVGVRPSRAVIERGTPVRNRGGRSTEVELGKVDHLLVEPESGEVSHLVVRRGLLPYQPVVPASAVRAVSEDEVTVALTDREVEALPRYKRRDAEDIEAELRDRFEEDGLDLEQIDLSLDSGVVLLLGWVPDVGQKRRAEAIARSTEGVIDVRNKLETELTVTTRVQQALLADPRTELSAIEVGNHQGGVVTLRGVVDSDEVRDAAEELAAAEPGVVSVVNELKVRPDTDAGILNARLLSLTMLGQRPR